MFQTVWSPHGYLISFCKRALMRGSTDHLSLAAWYKLFNQRLLYAQLNPQ